MEKLTDPFSFQTDFLDRVKYSAAGDTPCILIDLSQARVEVHVRRLRSYSQAVLIGYDLGETAPAIDPSDFDLLLSSSHVAGPPFVYVPGERMEQTLANIQNNILASPDAASMLCQVLRLSEQVELTDALLIESMAYSTLQSGRAFDKWLAGRDRASAIPHTQPRSFVEISRTDELVTIVLDDPPSRNAMSAGMRDALFEALVNVLEDPSNPDVKLFGNGACFSVGGDLFEFGTLEDPARAHAHRTLHSCAEILYRLGERAEVHLHGACIGSGLEVPCAASRRIASPGTFFQLPELRMGLIPGAGGTATLRRIIGRHRTAFLALSCLRVRIESVPTWGIAKLCKPQS